MRVLCVDRDGSWVAEASFNGEDAKGSADAWINLKELQKLRPAAPKDFETLPVICQGFYDSHMHPTWMAKLGSQLMCQQKSAAQILRDVEKFPSHRVYGFGWSEDAL